MMAGASPTRIPVRRQSAKAQPSTRASRLTSSRRARFPGLTASTRRMPARATNNPTTPDTADRVRLSASSWPTIRVRLAPSAARIAISLCRPVLRASVRLATLLAAISSTRKTAPVSIHNASRGRVPVNWRLNGTTLMPRFRSPAGNRSSRRRAIALISAWACATVTFGRSLPTTNHVSPPRTPRRVSQSGKSVCGSHTSAWSGSNWKPAGRMPMIWERAPSSTMVAPMASGEPAKRACQKR